MHADTTPKDKSTPLKEIEVNTRRDYSIKMFPEADFNKSFTFFYDETNNLKKFYVRESEFNAPFSSNFILGGLVFESSPPDLTELFTGLKLQKNISDVKLKHLAKGDFLDCLKSEKLPYFLSYLFDNKLCIHFSWINLLHWSTADIVDSAIANSEVAMKVGRFMADKVKSDFYKFAKIEIESILDLFYRYQYPNIKKADVVSFIDELTYLFNDYLLDDEFHFGLESLRQVLKEARKNESLPFLTDEEDYVLVKDFSSFYTDPICLFKNSTHIFDKEDDVVEIMKNTKLTDGKSELQNYSFVTSESNLIIQASDIIVGILGKLSSFLNTNSEEIVDTHINSLTDIQNKNIDLIIDLIDLSYAKNPGFQVMIDCQEETSKFFQVREIRNK